MKKVNPDHRPKTLCGIVLLIILAMITAYSANTNLLKHLTVDYKLTSPTATTVVPSQNQKPKRRTRPDSSKKNQKIETNGLTIGSNENLLRQPLATTDFNLIGLVGTVSPSTQTVPQTIPTAINTGVQVPEGENAFALISGPNTNYRIRGDENPIGQPLWIPALPNVGDHLMQNLRVIDISDPTGQTIAPVVPDSCAITVIERILVSQVQVHKMTYDEIVQSGINTTSNNYNFYNFTLDLTTSSGTVPIQIPVQCRQSAEGLPLRNPKGQRESREFKFRI